jgi:hypothetical protein
VQGCKYSNSRGPYIIMSSLRHIMDVDVEPLESQAYRRAREAAQELAPPSNPRSSVSPSPSLEDTKGKTPISRRRTNRVAKAGGQSATSARPSSTQRRDSASGEAMDFTSAYQAGGSNQASTSGSPPQSSSRGSEAVGDVPVKYTPVTGRISRAKKGVPVHTCKYPESRYLQILGLTNLQVAFVVLLRSAALRRNFDLLAYNLRRLLHGQSISDGTN